MARRRPWKLARETVSLDRLSKGRLGLGVGLGEPSDADFSFDVAVIGSRPSLGKPAEALKKLAELERAGATWWLDPSTWSASQPSGSPSTSARDRRE